MPENISSEKSLQQKVFTRLWLLVLLIVCNSLLAGWMAFWHDSELKNYNILVTILDVYYWLLMLPGIIIAGFSRFRWYLYFLSVLFYIAAVWIGFGHL